MRRVKENRNCTLPHETIGIYTYGVLYRRSLLSHFHTVSHSHFISLYLCRSLTLSTQRIFKRKVTMPSFFCINSQMSETCFPDCASDGFKSRYPDAPTSFASMFEEEVISRRETIPNDFPPLVSTSTQTSPSYQLPPPPPPPKIRQTIISKAKEKDASHRKKSHPRRRNACMVSQGHVLLEG